ncbi:MAG TPA: hypothetical protein PKC28_13915, partial [Bdellovibrionales bacterium]|nr:hypothetical protein [Bdellovibrionales bacterium]
VNVGQDVDRVTMDIFQAAMTVIESSFPDRYQFVKGPAEFAERIHVQIRLSSVVPRDQRHARRTLHGFVETFGVMDPVDLLINIQVDRISKTQPVGSMIVAMTQSLFPDDTDRALDRVVGIIKQKSQTAQPIYRQMLTDSLTEIEAARAMIPKSCVGWILN